MVIGTMLAIIVILLIVFILAALPLHLAVRFLGGRTTLLKTAFVNLIVGLLVGIITALFSTFTSIIAFILSVVIYRESFRMKWWKACILWLISLVFAVILAFIVVLVAGLLSITVPALW